MTTQTTAFHQLTGTIEAGQSAIAKVHFILETDANGVTVDPSGGSVSWQLIDSTGALFSSGVSTSFLVTPQTFGNVVEATAVVNIPSEVPPSDPNTAYLLRWALHLDSTNLSNVHQYSSESLQITGFTNIPLGADKVIEMQGDSALMTLITAANPVVNGNVVTATVFSGNAAVQGPLSVTPNTANGRVVSTGYMHQVDVNTASLPISLDPYSVVWKYIEPQGTGTGRVMRETGSLFVVAPSHLQAIDDVQAQVMKARTTLFGLQDALFGPDVVMTWLRRGRDMFNAAGGIITRFDMSNATGGVREFWLRYSEIAALRSQALAEGEKAFNYSGLQVTLEVDKSGPYKELADALASDLEQQVTTFKKNLSIQGITSGSGDIMNTGPAANALGYVGISQNAISPMMSGGRIFF